MKTLLVSAAVLGLTASASVAAQSGPLMLTDYRMDGVTAGQIENNGGIQVAAPVRVGNVQVAVPLQAGVRAIVENCNPDFDPQTVVNRRAIQPGP